MTKISSLNSKRTQGSLAERFARYVFLSDNECWRWLGAKNDRGYGVIGNGTRCQGISKAHRVSYEIFYFTKLSKTKFICHACDNPGCVNPKHLFVCTQADNVADMIAKDRNSPPPIRRGEAASFAKLTEPQIRQIRQLSKTGTSSSKIAKTFAVSKTTILQIVNHKSWRHV
ncbi:MAG: hypothetical protein Tsb006_5100 [Rickettsiaceae bacterium]